MLDFIKTAIENLTLALTTTTVAIASVFSPTPTIIAPTATPIPTIVQEISITPTKAPVITSTEENKTKNDSDKVSDKVNELTKQLIEKNGITPQPTPQATSKSATADEVINSIDALKKKLEESMKNTKSLNTNISPTATPLHPI